ncbi:MAG TPA: hypothetical protein VNV43_12775, partial [Candidatus Acidoferrales bacterium]|nr:hypothetical protein [Candidatus Acidoferrales bacterium]
LEVVNPDDRGVGDLIVTTLTNDYMPLLRYRIGDLVERRSMPYATNYIVHGRARDAIRDGNGRRVTSWDVDQCFNDVAGIVHYQVHQEKDGTYQFRYIPDGDEPGEMKTVVAKLEHVLKPHSPITVESVPMLPPTPSGKFRLTVRAE